MNHRVFNYLLGNVKIRLISSCPERFLNICSQKRILLWHIQNEEDKYTFYISIKDVFRLKDVLKKTKSRIHIEQKNGLPFFSYKNRKRKGFVLGILLFAIILYVLSLFVWDISLDGGYTYSEQEMREFLLARDIHHGLLKANLNCDDIEKEIRNKFVDITWVCAEIKGTRLVIHIKENFDSDIIELEDKPYDLVANKDAKIVSIITRSGTSLVKVNDEVKSGDILISGIIDIYNDAGEIENRHSVKSDADIYGQTIYQYEDIFALEHEVKYYTGKSTDDYYIDTSGKKIAFRVGKSRYKKYDTMSFDNTFKILRNFYLPIHYGRVSYREYEKTILKYTEKEAENLANIKLQVFLENLTKKGIQIVEKDVTIAINEDVCRASGQIIVIEKLGKVADITINEEGHNENEYN